MKKIELNIVEIDQFEFPTIVNQINNDYFRPLRLAADKLALLEKLNTTIELQPLLTIYASEINGQLPVFGLEFENCNNKLQLKYSTMSNFSYGSNLKCSSQLLGRIIYLTSKKLTIRQRQIIASMEQQLLQPLYNVLRFEQSRKLALRDHLTGLGNRNYFEDTYGGMMTIAQCKHREFSLLMLDLDNFKSVNDQYGHHEGDLVLVEFARLLQSSLRSDDHVFRFGGDEFIMLLTYSTSLQPEQVASRIIEAVSNNSLLKKHQLTTSIGIADWLADDDDISMLNRADKALYQAKRQGKCNNHR